MGRMKLSSVKLWANACEIAIFRIHIRHRLLNSQYHLPTVFTILELKYLAGSRISIATKMVQNMVDFNGSICRKTPYKFISRKIEELSRECQLQDVLLVQC